MTRSVAYRAASATVDELVDHLRREVRLVSVIQSPRHLMRHHLDTFDWRLYRAGLRSWVEEEGRRRELVVARAGDEELHRDSVDEVPAFAWDLAETAFEDVLGPPLGVRRLLPQATTRLARRRWNVLDKRDKTVVRLVAEAIWVVGGGEAETPLGERIVVQELRGYGKAFRRLCARLDELGAGEDPAFDELDEALAALGRRPADYVSKPTLALDPAQPAEAAIRAILRQQLDMIRRNETGTRADLDSEFLHDFRVALRRTRSCLSQLKGVLPADRVAPFRDEFRWLGGLTGPTRDLDVYLLKMRTYRAWLPAHVHADLEPLDAFLHRHQKIEQRKLAAALESDRYHRLLDEWDAFLHEPVGDDPQAPLAHRPIREVANKRLRKAFRRVLRQGRAIRPDSPAVLVHEERISCKKLRYLLEFFRSLYPEKPMKRLIKALKVLQDNLGDFNDYEVQQVKLYEFAEAMMEESRVRPRVFMAMGRLVAKLEEGQQRERQAFHQRFEAFASRENRRLFKEMIG